LLLLAALSLSGPVAHAKDKTPPPGEETPGEELTPITGSTALAEPRTAAAKAETDQAGADTKLVEAETERAEVGSVLAEWTDACFPDEGFLAMVPEGSRRSYRVCVDATNGPHVIHVPTRPWPNLLPHHRLVVLVKHRRDDVVTAQVDGTVGIYIPGTDNAASLGVKGKSAATVLSGSPPESGDRYTRYVFPKYLPGEITLTVEVEPKPLEAVT